MERDYGLTTEELEAMFDSASGDSAATGQSSDAAAAAAGAGDMASVASEMGVDLSSLDFLLDSGGFDPRMLSQLPEEEFAQLIDLLEAVLKRGGGALGGLPGPAGTRDMGGGPSERRSGREERAATREQRRRDRVKERQDRQDRRGKRGRENRETGDRPNNDVGERDGALEPHTGRRHDDRPR